MGDVDLPAFVQESNRIERIIRPPNEAEIAAHRTLLALQRVTLDDMRAFVHTVAEVDIRDRSGMNVIVGGHVAPPGGPTIPAQLSALLDDASAHRDAAWAFRTHVAYETLHPFMDGNGRSGRALWLWQMRGSAPLLFLHTWYYQTLRYGSGRS